MKLSMIIIICITGLLFFTGNTEGKHSRDSDESQGEVQIIFEFSRQSIIASNQFAVWIEDMDGNIIKTVFVTHFTGKGGYNIRKNSLPIWVKKTKPETMDDEKIDAITGATPKSDNLTYRWDCTDLSGNPVPAGEYRFFVEGTLHWEDSVLFTGVIPIGGEEITVRAKAIYSTEDSIYKNMLRNVSATYVKK